MKKLYIGAFAILCAIGAYAQTGKVISAYNYLGEYNSSNKKEDLIEAARNIDLAATDESTSGMTKTWWYRAKIYGFLSADTNFATKYPKASIEAVHSYQKMKEINDPKFKDWGEAYENMKALVNTAFNDGITAFTKKNYHDAYLYFSSVSDVNDLLVSKDQKPLGDILGKALANAALSAENDNNYVDATAAYKKLIAMNGDVKAYISLIGIMKRQKDIDGAKKITDEALAKYPSNKDLLIYKINFYMQDGKFSDAITYLQKAADQDPKNEQIQSALGVAYEQVKDTASARKVYENILTMNPNSFEANYGLGGMIFNQTKPIQEKMNSLGATKEDIAQYDKMKITRDALFMQAKPYLDKAAAAKPDDAEVKKALNTIDAMTRK